MSESSDSVNTAINEVRKWSLGDHVIFNVPKNQKDSFYAGIIQIQSVCNNGLYVIMDSSYKIHQVKQNSILQKVIGSSSNKKTKEPVEEPERIYMEKTDFPVIDYENISANKIKRFIIYDIFRYTLPFCKITSGNGLDKYLKEIFDENLKDEDLCIDDEKRNELKQINDQLFNLILGVMKKDKKLSEITRRIYMKKAMKDHELNTRGLLRSYYQHYHIFYRNQDEMKVLQKYDDLTLVSVTQMEEYILSIYEYMDILCDEDSRFKLGCNIIAMKILHDLQIVKNTKGEDSSDLGKMIELVNKVVENDHVSFEQLHVLIMEIQEIILSNQVAFTNRYNNECDRFVRKVASRGIVDKCKKRSRSFYNRENNLAIKNHGSNERNKSFKRVKFNRKGNKESKPRSYTPEEVNKARKILSIHKRASSGATNNCENETDRNDNDSDINNSSDEEYHSDGSITFSE